MTPSEAAEIIGCSPQHVRTLIRQGRIKAKTQYSGRLKLYDVPAAEAKRIRDALPADRRGWPRGQKRK